MGINSMQRKQCCHLIVLSFVTFLLLHVHSQNTTVQEYEKTILLELKTYLRNSSYIKHQWSLSSPYCSWLGISCSHGGSVTGIHLEGGYLTAIPPIICKLKNLTVVELGSNYLSGLFPTTLCNCTKLEILDLSGNQLHGPLPTDIHRMSRLTTLYLGLNNFNGTIPRAVGQLSKLKYLSLGVNYFKGSIPRGIGNLSNLKMLDMSDMENFENATIPDELGKLKNLTDLWLSNSNLIGNIPEDLSSLSSLETLDLSRNYLAGPIPSSLFDLENLTFLYLNDNELSGSLPNPIGKLKIDIIDLRGNKLSGKIPLEFEEHSNYHFFDNFNLSTSDSSLLLNTNPKHRKAIDISSITVGVLVISSIIFIAVLLSISYYYIVMYLELCLSRRSWTKMYGSNFDPGQFRDFTKRARVADDIYPLHGEGVWERKAIVDRINGQDFVSF